MPTIPFTVYDFFGYLASGFLLILTAAYVTGKRCLFPDDLSFLASVFLILLAYILGHLMAEPAKLVYERLIIGRLLKRPDENLFHCNSKKFLAKIFPEYYDSFPEAIREKIRKKAEDEGIADIGKPLFTHAYGKVKKDNDAINRVDIFLTLYGFCRNTSFTLFFIFVLIFIGGWHRGIGINYFFCLLSILAAI